MCIRKLIWKWQFWSRNGYWHRWVTPQCWHGISSNQGEVKRVHGQCSLHWSNLNPAVWELDGSPEAYIPNSATRMHCLRSNGLLLPSVQIQSRPCCLSLSLEQPRHASQAGEEDGWAAMAITQWPLPVEMPGRDLWEGASKLLSLSSTEVWGSAAGHSRCR